MIDPKHTAFVDGPDKPSVYINYVPTWDFLYAHFADKEIARPRTVDFQKDTGHFEDQSLVVYIPFGFKDGWVCGQGKLPVFEYKGPKFDPLSIFIVRIDIVYDGFPGIREGYKVFSIVPYKAEGELLTEINKNATAIIKQIEQDQEVLTPPWCG